MTLNDRIIAALKAVRDPELPINVYDLGLIYNLSSDEGGHVSIRMTLTAPNCPVAKKLPSDVKSAVLRVEGVISVALELVFDPPWSKSRMSEDAKFALGVDDLIPAEGLINIR